MQNINVSLVVEARWLIYALYIVYSETVDLNVRKFNLLSSIWETMDIVFWWNFANFLCQSHSVHLSGISALKEGYSFLEKM